MRNLRLLYRILLISSCLTPGSTRPATAADGASPLDRIGADVAEAQREFAAGHWPEATALAESVLERLDAGNTAAFPLRGHVLRLLALCHQAPHGDAVMAYDAAISAGMRDADVLYGKGESLRLLDREAEAIECFDASLGLRPDQPDVLRARGLARMAMHENDEAIADFARAAVIAPRDPRHLITLAVMQRRMGDIEESRQTLSHAIALAEATGDHRRRGEALAALRRWPEAFEALDTAIARDPQDLEAVSLRSAALAARHDGNAALADARAIVGRDPRNASHWLRVGDIERDQLHDTAAALRAYDRGLGMAPRHVGLLVARGRLASERNDYVAAISDFVTAAAENPRSPAIYEARAAMHVRRREFVQAVAVFDLLAEMVPRDPGILRRRAGVWHALKKSQTAVADCDRAIALLPPRDHAGRGELHREAKRWPESIAAYTAAIAADPGNARLLHDRAWVYNEIEEFTKAAADCRAGLEIDPEDPDLAKEHAYACKGLGEDDVAIESFTKMLECRPAGDASLYSYRGQAWMQKKEYATAASDFQCALAREPLNPSYWDWLGAAHRERGDFDAALRCFDEAVRIDPDMTSGHVNRGWVLRQKGCFADAVAAYGRVVVIDPDFADGFHSRGECHERLGNLDGAEADYAEAARLEPDEPTHRAALERVRAVIAALQVASHNPSRTRGPRHCLASG